MMKNIVAAYLDDCHDAISMVNIACRAFNRTSKTHHLSCMGYSSAKEFLQDYKSNPKRFDSILLDLRLDDEHTGWSVFDEIVTEDNETSVIVYSSEISPDDDLPSMMSKKNFTVQNWIDRIDKLKDSYKSNLMQICIRMGEMTGTVNHV